MFQSCPNFNQDISGWNTSSVTNMSYMFRYATLFDQNIGGWNVSSVTDMPNMFESCSAFNQDLNSWNVSSVTNMVFMFANASTFNGNITSWNISSVTNMAYMFYGASAFNQDISDWDTGNVIYMSSMFQRAYVFNQNVSTKISNDGSRLAWSVNKVTNMDNMFNMEPFDNSLGNFNNGETPSDGTSAGNNPIRWDTSSVTDMTYIFRNCRRFNQDISCQVVTFNNGTVNETFLSFDTSSVTSFLRSLAYCEAFNNGDIAGQSNTPMKWNTNSATSMNYMFGLYNFFVTSTGSYNQPMIKETVTHALGSYTSWDTSSVNDFFCLFQNQGNFNQDISSWDTSSVTTTQSMFNSASAFNQDISGWTTTSVTDMSNMFNSASAFNQNIGSWNLGSISTMANMLDNSGMSVANYSDTLIGWNANVNTPNTITFGASTLQYNDDGETARNNLTGTKSWTISDAGLACMHETTTVLCLINGKEEYVNIKNIEEGDDIITYKDGIVKVKQIHKVQTFNSKKRKITNFYKLDKSKNSILTHDLIITGGHSVVLNKDEISEQNLKYMESINTDNNHKVHDKYKLLCSKNPDFECVVNEQVEDVYMLLLENNDPLYTYGVYVNGGYLIESCGEQSFINLGYIKKNKQNILKTFLDYD